jgi:putative oxidoreductase
MRALFNQANDLMGRIPQDIVSLALRIFPAMVFFQSGRTKVEGLFSIKESTWFLFEKNNYGL